MTPLEIEILFHYATRGDDHRCCTDGSPIWPETRDWMLKEGLLRPQTKLTSKTYEVTERAQFFLDHITSLPLPISQWRMP